MTAAVSLRPYHVQADVDGYWIAYDTLSTDALAAVQAAQHDFRQARHVVVDVVAISQIPATTGDTTMTRCDNAGRRDGVGSTDEQDSISGLLDTLDNRSGCAHLSARPTRKVRPPRAETGTVPHVLVMCCIVILAISGLAWCVRDLAELLHGRL